MTQRTLGYIVSRLTRLFHVPQTRRGGGLLYQSASCCYWSIIIIIIAIFVIGIIIIIFIIITIIITDISNIIVISINITNDIVQYMYSVHTSVIYLIYLIYLPFHSAVNHDRPYMRIWHRRGFCTFIMIKLSHTDEPLVNIKHHIYSSTLMGAGVRWLILFHSNLLTTGANAKRPCNNIMYHEIKVRWDIKYLPSNMNRFCCPLFIKSISSQLYHGAQQLHVTYFSISLRVAAPPLGNHRILSATLK